jgi:hypothetical protein
MARRVHAMHVGDLRPAATDQSLRHLFAPLGTPGDLDPVPRTRLVEQGGPSTELILVFARKLGRSLVPKSAASVMGHVQCEALALLGSTWTGAI